MSLDILDGVEEEVSLFNHEERPNWPMTPTKCTLCDAGPYKCHSSYQRHWAMKHSATVTIFQCSLSLCTKKFGRRKDGVAHLKKVHKYPGKLASKTIPNIHYMDPKGVLSYQVDHRQRLRQKRKQTEVAPDLTTERADCRDEETTFDEEGNVTGKKFKTT
ncbi:hypothetical protein DPMN_000807 [Dreissena polymorpha]|uniref:C2H2-type domain-containing protein n=2 Tax=Dreissena polymorpha TaxID=45954 RepID=A0A9D4MJQ8_DREPO|nr:hypothetical protein DPMN_000807 [Dreissena polymorpha]